MALVHVFNGLVKHESYNINGTLKNSLPDLDYTHSLILRGGKRINELTELNEGDIVFVRKLPTDPVTWIVTGVTLVLMGGAALGSLLYKQNLELQKIEDAAKAAKENTNINKLPYIKGARNTAATGQSFPFFIGKSLFSPYRLCPPHISIEGGRGEKQFYNFVLECGYNELLFNEIKLGETVIKKFTDTTPQNGQYSFDEGVFFDEKNLIEIRQTGDFENDEFNKKIIFTELSKEIPHDHLPSDATQSDVDRINEEWKAGVVQDLPTNAMSAELIVLIDGLRQWDTNAGVWKSASLTLKPQWTNVNNPSESDWHNFDNGFVQGATTSNTFEYRTKEQMRFIARQEFAAVDAYNQQIKVRVIRTTPKAESNAKDTVYLLGVQSECYDAKKSNENELISARVLEETETNKCTRLAVRLTANKNTDGLLDAISIVAQGMARVWDGESWSENKEPTSNLAAWLLEIMTSSHHRPSAYSDDELDLNSFGDLYEYCAREGFNADGVITKGVKKSELLNTLCQNSNSTLVYNPSSGKIEVAIDNGRDYSVALFNSNDIISISTTREFKRTPDGVKMKYINAAGNYDIDTFKVMRDGGEYDPEAHTLTDLTADYITSFTHAYKYAWRKIAEQMAQPRSATVKVSREGAYYPLYGRVEVQHKTFKNGLSHNIIKSVRITGGLITAIVLDAPVEYPVDSACGVVVNCSSDTSRGVLALKVDGLGKTDTLELLEPLNINAELVPHYGDVVTFGALDSDGEFTTVTTSMKITNVEESGNDGYNLTLVDYNPDLYNYGTIPTYKSNLTKIPTTSVVSIDDQREYATPEEIAGIASEAGATAAAGAAQVAIDTVASGMKFTNLYNVRNPEFTLEEIIAKIDEDNRNNKASISISEEEILLSVEDVEKELRGQLSVTAGAVSAMVEGGGTAGQLALSIQLPVVIDETTRQKFVDVSSETAVNAVYGQIESTSNYGIKPNATASALRSLWGLAVSAGLMASQIDLSATQINIAAEHIKITSGTDADKLLIEDGQIRASLIEAQKIQLKNKGVICSDNYSGEIDENGEITKYGTEGWAIDHTGKSDFVNINATGGIFKNINATGGIFNNIELSGTIGGFSLLENKIYKPVYNRELVFLYDDEESPTGTGTYRRTDFKAILVAWIENNTLNYAGGTTQLIFTFGYTVLYKKNSVTLNFITENLYVPSMPYLYTQDSKKQYIQISDSNPLIISIGDRPIKMSKLAIK